MGNFLTFGFAHPPTKEVRQALNPHTEELYDGYYCAISILHTESCKQLTVI